MELIVDAWKCDIDECGHVWLKRSEVPPTHCAKCKSRSWNNDSEVKPKGKIVDKDHVYIIHCPEVGLYKIGSTSNPEKRLKQIQSASAYKLEEPIILNCDPKFGLFFEKLLHNKFSHCRAYGEWFKLKKEDVEWLKSKPSLLTMESPTVSLTQKLPCNGCGKCLDCLRIERSQKIEEAEHVLGLPPAEMCPLPDWLTSSKVNLKPDKVQYNEREIDGYDIYSGSGAHLEKIRFDNPRDVPGNSITVQREQLVPNLDDKEEAVIKKLKSIKSCKECGSLSGVHAKGCKKA
jgi:hypothetical protein